MIGCHHNDIVSTRQVPSILICCSARSLKKSSAVVVEHNRTLTPIGRRRPNIEKQAVFMRRGLVDSPIALTWLPGRRAQSQRVPYPGPGPQGRGGFEAT